MLTAGKARTLGLAVAGIRAGIGASALVAPGLLARPWVGEGGSPSARVLGRSLGGRDLALGLGAILAARRGRPLRGWVEAGGLADAGDVIATVIAWKALPPAGRVLVLAVAGGAMAAAALAAPGISS